MRYPKGYRTPTLRPYVYSRTTAKGDVMWNANVKGPTGTIYLATRASQIEAKAIAAIFIATGERPAKQKRGPKRGTSMPNRARAIHVVPRPGRPPKPPKPVEPPKPAQNRLDMMRAIMRRQADAVPTRHH